MSYLEVSILISLASGLVAHPGLVAVGYDQPQSFCLMRHTEVETSMIPQNIVQQTGDYTNGKRVFS